MQVSTSVGSGTGGSSKGIAVFPTGQLTLFVLVTVLFFLWGMSNNLTDILVRQFQKSFQLSQFSAATGADCELSWLLLHGHPRSAGDEEVGI